MDNETAYKLLLHKAEGTFLLRENEKGELRATIRSNLKDGTRNGPKIGHIPISKHEDGNGWIMGQNYYPSISKLVESQKKIESAFQMKHEYRPWNWFKFSKECEQCTHFLKRFYNTIKFSEQIDNWDDSDAI